MMAATSSFYNRKQARPQSTTRLDIVTILANSAHFTTPARQHQQHQRKQPRPGTDAAKSTMMSSTPLSNGLVLPPRSDSLSPLTGDKTVPQGFQQRRRNLRERASAFGDVLGSRGNRAGAMPSGREAQPQLQVATGPPTTQLPVRGKQHEACSPRSPPPHALTLPTSHGCTTIPVDDLKQRISDSRTESSTTLAQVPLDKRQQLPPTPTTPWTIMGNKPSSVADDKSQRSVVRRNSRQPLSRKSSYNIFKRVDSKSPLPRDVTASVMSVLHRDGHKKGESNATNEDDDEDGLETLPSDPFFEHPERHDSRYPSLCPKIHSASTITMTEDRAALPLSASTTIRDSRSAAQSPAEDYRGDGATDSKDLPPLPPEDSTLSPLSPTLPAPSPLPEDSPHKYGLRNKMDTPEVPEPAEPINVTKMRRKSSGLEIFNEAKSLQSAQSFLNGLSTSRRRAESASAMRTTDATGRSWATTENSAPSRPASTRPASTRPIPQDGEGRRKGHNFKASGFAYSRPLTLTQIKCYRGHARLLPSSNKHAPVECSVCHIDDDAEHFSCSFCALRMCRYCRNDFAERGLNALKQRVRQAELGGADDSANSSSESLTALRKSKSTTFA